MVDKLRCKICTKLQPNIQGRKNFSDKWIVCSESVHVSIVWDNAHNDQHTHALKLLTKERSTAPGLGPSVYAPIVRALNRLPNDERRRLMFKFDFAHFTQVWHCSLTECVKRHLQVAHWFLALVCKLAAGRHCISRWVGLKQSLLMVFSAFWKVPYNNLEYRPSLKAIAKGWLGLPQMGHLLILLQWD